MHVHIKRVHIDIHILLNINKNSRHNTPISKNIHKSRNDRKRHLNSVVYHIVTVMENV